MSDPLEIRLLGPFEVIAGGRRVDIPGWKRQALLAMLALARCRVVAVDDLIDALWGADLPAAPRNAVQHHVARLRAALGHEAVAGLGDGYALHLATVDAVAFEGLLAAAVTARRDGDPHAAAADAAAALALWRGAALQGLTDAPWFGAEARRLDALRLDAQEERFDAALALGEHREVVPDLRAALDENPYRERLWGAADARPVSQRPPGGRARCLPRGAANPLRQSRTRAWPGASRSAGGDPRARPGDRRGARGAGPAGQPALARHLIRRPRGGARPGRRRACRAPRRDAARAAGRREDSHRPGGGSAASARHL